MRVLAPPSPVADKRLHNGASGGGGGGGGGGGYKDKDAESLFRTKPISEIRNVEAATRYQIQEKSEELRQLVGNRYRDLIDSADSIVLMKSSCDSISTNIAHVHRGILLSLSSEGPLVPRVLTNTTTNSARAKLYGIACRVKYLVDTPENIWGCLDESMFLEAAARYTRAKQVHHVLVDGTNDKAILSNFPLLQQQWQIVESFKTQISQRSRERLLSDHFGIGIAAYADALAAVAIIDELEANQVLSLFLDSKKSCISQKLGSCCTARVTSSDVVSSFCDVLKIIQVTVGQVGELFLQVLNDLPLFHKIILGSPPASQLFGGIPNPDEEVRMWRLFRDKLESAMVMLDREFIAKTCSTWLSSCGREVANRINGRYLINAIDSGKELALAEKMMRETMESKQVLEGSLDWLKNVFGSEIELPWNRIRELVLESDTDLWDDIFEDAFVQRMKVVIDSGFDHLNGTINVRETVHAISEASAEANLDWSHPGGAVWFIDQSQKQVGSRTLSNADSEGRDILSCLNAYFGTKVTQIRDAVDSHCETILEDLLSFLDSPKAAVRLKDLAPYLQNKCFKSISAILMDLKAVLGDLASALKNMNADDKAVSRSTIVDKSLFVGRLLFAFHKHSRHIPVLLGSPRLWVTTKSVGYGKSASLFMNSRRSFDSPLPHSPGGNYFDSSKIQISLATAALVAKEGGELHHLDELNRLFGALTTNAYNLWISWVVDELSVILSHNVRQDDGLSTTCPVRGWEETVVKQEQSNDSHSELKILLPSMPSLYITSLLFRACEEIHRVGGHVIDKSILQMFAKKLMEKVSNVYAELQSNQEYSEAQMSDKGALQVLLDLRFVADVLVGDSLHKNEGSSKKSEKKFSLRRKQDVNHPKSGIEEQLDDLLRRFSEMLDPIDWLTYEPYLWENGRQAYLRHAVLFGFFVQLNRLYTDCVQKLPTNSESNILRCSTIPRFKYLPISVPALSSRAVTQASMSNPSDDISLRNSWRKFSNEELSSRMDIDDNSSFGVATPLLKSFMQVGSRFGESTMKLGSILTDGQVGRFNAMSTFGDILPVQAAGLLSSFTSRSDSSSSSS